MGVSGPEITAAKLGEAVQSLDKGSNNFWQGVAICSDAKPVPLSIGYASSGSLRQPSAGNSGALTHACDRDNEATSQFGNSEIYESQEK
jgi:hypothetical protein